MLVFILKNFFLFNYIYSVFNFNKNYINNFLIPLNRVLFYKKSTFLIFKRLIFYKLLKRKKCLNIIFYLNLKIYFLNSKLFFNFDILKFLNKKNVIFEKIFIFKTKFFLKNYILNLYLNGYFFKLLIFII